MIRLNKNMLAATLLICGTVQAEKDNTCLNIMSWVNGKFRLFSTECPDGEVHKPKKIKTKENPKVLVQEGPSWSFSGLGNKVTITNHTDTDIVVNNRNGYPTIASDYITVSDEDNFNGKTAKTVKLTGNKKRIALQDALDTVSVHSSIAHITMNDKDSYIECDEAVFDSDLRLGVKNGKLEPKLPKNTGIKFKGTRGEPLCTVLARMLNDSLFVEGSSKVHVDTPAAKRITTSSFSQVSTGENATGIESIDASGSAKVTMPYASALKKIVATSFSDVSTGATSVESIDASGSAKVRVLNAPMLKKIKADSFSDVSIGNNVTSVESINASGSAKVTIPNLNTKTFKAVLDSFAQANIQGNCDQQSVITSGSSAYNASDLKSNFAIVNASSFSSVKLWVNRVLGGRADGSASVRYHGDAIDSVKTSSFASCKKARF